VFAPCGGYGHNAIVHRDRLDPGVELVAQPFTWATLGIRMCRLLEQR